jgi:hypothetical protein
MRSAHQPRHLVRRLLSAGILGSLGLIGFGLAPPSHAATAPAVVADQFATVPAPIAIELTPLERAGIAEGNALLSLSFEQREGLGDEIVLNAERRKHVLKRDPNDPTRFSGMIDFDFDLFVREQQQREALIKESREEKSPVFSGRELLGHERFGFLDPAIVERARIESLPFRIPRDVIVLPLSFVDPARELMITAPPVVNDPGRTFDICGNVGNPNGAWTFKTLMSNMANTPLTGVDPSDFVERWVRTWQVNNTLNTFPVPARPNIGPLVLNSWPRIAGKLDLNQSPFRLLAIVNRVDLRGNSVYGSSNAGEGRFVFGVVNRNSAGGCSTTRFTVILEYGVPIRGCAAVRSYGQQWDNLGNLVLGSPAYNTALQAITDQFTSANAAPNKPNRSAINQVRSNENALNPLWELREFVLRQGNPLLQISSTVQTPHHSWNNSGLLANYINTNAAALVAGTNVIPALWAGQPFLTGSNFNFGVANAQVWNAPGVANQPRHMLSLNTCNACHGGEARDSTVPGDLPFLHVGVRLPAGTSQLSKFLLGNGTLAAPSTFNKPDPINGAPVRQFGDLLRRQQDLSNLVNSSCLSTGLINQLQFQPLQMVH